jgi:hypothetical protein
MEWIDVKEKLPPQGDWVIIGSATKKCVDYGAYFREKFYMCADDQPVNWVTHWMPLPEPPNG